jgi:hypothetical protein
MDELEREMEEMFRGLGALNDPSSSADGAGASSANAEDEPTPDMRFLADLLAKSMASIPSEVAGESKPDATGEPKDDFWKSRDEAAERLRKSNADLQVITGLYLHRRARAR